jgi:DNA-binding protein Fis
MRYRSGQMKQDDQGRVVREAVVQMVREWQRIAAAPATAQRRAIQLDNVAGAHIDRVLELCGGSTGRAAKLLGVDRRTLQRRMASARGARKPGRRKSIDVAAALRLRDRGQTWGAIARRLRCSEKGLLQAVRRARRAR